MFSRESLITGYKAQVCWSNFLILQITDWHNEIQLFKYTAKSFCVQIVDQIFRKKISESFAIAVRYLVAAFHQWNAFTIQASKFAVRALLEKSQAVLLQGHQICQPLTMLVSSHQLHFNKIFLFQVWVHLSHTHIRKLTNPTTMKQDLPHAF